MIEAISAHNIFLLLVAVGRKEIITCYIGVSLAERGRIMFA
jgi:hypothetical protein